LRACYTLGVRFQVGEDVPRDYEVARRLFAHACEGGDSYACNGLGRLYENGHGVERDAERALALYHRACDAEDWPVCYYIGYLHAHGRLVPEDASIASQYYRRACDHGYENACRALIVPPIVPASEVYARLGAFMNEGARAALASVRGQTHDPAFDGPHDDLDLRASTRSEELTRVRDPEILASVWLFEWSELAEEPEYAVLQLMVFAFPDGRVRWTVLGEMRDGRADREMMEATIHLDAAPVHLWWPLDDAFVTMREGECTFDFATSSDVSALPEPVRADVDRALAAQEDSCAILRARSEDSEWVPSSRFFVALVRANRAIYSVNSDVQIGEDGRAWLTAAMATAF
jgi:hypothetical protein